MDEIKVEIPPYCSIPYNKIQCIFLKKGLFKKCCKLFNVRVWNAVDNWRMIILPCKECKTKREAIKQIEGDSK